MKQEQLYNKTVDILVQAYFNDTLRHGNCYACAVGNLIAANKGIKMVANNDGDIKWDGYKNYMDNTDDLFPLWFSAIKNCIKDEKDFLVNEAMVNELIYTGYSVDEIYKIEEAFEDVWEDDDCKDYMFKGLMQVIDILDQIHENTDTQVTTETKNKFQKHFA